MMSDRLSRKLMLFACSMWCCESRASLRKWYLLPHVALELRVSALVLTGTRSKKIIRTMRDEQASELIACKMIGALEYRVDAIRSGGA